MARTTNRPKVAVITIYHNREDHVTESVSSLISQTYDNLDIIIVDDHSRDGTFAKIEEVCVGRDNVTLIKNTPNKGFTASLIDVISNLDVKYVAIHGSGDISSALRIEEQVNYLESNSEVGVLTTNLGNRKNTTDNYDFVEITLSDLLKRNRITHGAVMFNLSSYHKAGGYRRFFSSRQDKDLWYRMSLVTKIHYLNRKLYTLVKVTDSVSHNSHKSDVPTLLSCFAKHLINERLRNGKDSLDIHGERAGLLFKPSECNGLLYLLLFRSLRKLKFKPALDYVDNLIRFNTNVIHIGALHFLKIWIYLMYKMKLSFSVR